MNARERGRAGTSRQAPALEKALEAVPFESGAGVFEVRQILLPMNGTDISENVNTAVPAKDKA